VAVPAGSRVVPHPEPTARGICDGLHWVALAPAGPPAGAVVVLHGADSRKENHLGFARAVAGAGLLALVADLRGHGASPGPLDGRALEDVAALAGVARELAGGAPVALRGSSMGGWLALCAARQAGAAAVVAICPASSDGLTRGLRDGRFAFPADRPALEALLAAVSPAEAVADLGCPLLLLHAAGDERVPVAGSVALHEAAPGSRLVVVPGGHHGSAQHDPELEALSLRFLRRSLAR
jgi:pimeloyl-ACP methyl ester carboxylesterase